MTEIDLFVILPFVDQTPQYPLFNLLVSQVGFDLAVISQFSLALKAIKRSFSSSLAAFHYWIHMAIAPDKGKNTFDFEVSPPLV